LDGIGRERLQVNVVGPRTADERSQLPLVALGSSGSEEEERPLRGPVEKVVEELPQLPTRPLQVLEQQDQRLDITQSFEEQPPRGEEFLAGEVTVCRVEQDPQTRLDESSLVVV
jgi:hypothetical protein